MAYMKRENDGGSEKGQQSPGENHLIGLGPTGERAEREADDQVYRTYEYHRSEPFLATRFSHVCGLHRAQRGAAGSLR